MPLGGAVTNKFHIGSAEIRIGPLSSANKLTPANSMGLLQSATVNFAQESVDLKGGLPRTLIDTAIVETTVNVSAQASEYSRKNIRIMLNEGVEAVTPSEYAGAVTTAETALTTGTSVIDTDILEADVSVGDLIVFYAATSPEKVSVVKVTAKAVVNTDKAAITIDNTRTPLLFDLAVGDKVYKANDIGLGKSGATNYFTCDVIGKEHSTGRPIGFKFWKAAFSGGLEYAFTNDNFATTPITLKVLQPAASEYAAGQPLAHVSDLIVDRPFGMFIGG